MAGPWFVDPENGLTTNDGLSVDTPWKLIPGQTGATAQTGYGVVAGDTINVKNGTRSTLRLILPANNLTYRGYGIAENVLELILPKPGSPKCKIVKRVAREWGAHEGMWILDAGDNTTIGWLSYTTRSGCVVEDVFVTSPASATAVSMGPSTSTATGCTLRRSMVCEGAGHGVSAYSRQITLEDVRIENIDDDAIFIGGNATNSNRAGTADVLSNICLINPGRDEIAATGDGINTFSTTESLESSLTIKNLYCYKPSTIKQMMVIANPLGGFSLDNFHYEGSDLSHGQILLSGVGGNFVISNGYFQGGCDANAVVRISGAYGIATGASLTVKNVAVNAALNSGFFTLGSSTIECTVDGAINIQNCSINGTNTQGFSFSAGISFHPGSTVTIGANATFTATNNLLLCAGQPAVRLPTGAGNDAKYAIQNNATGGLSFAIGATSYADVAAFQAAHSAATGNIGGDAKVSSALRPLPGSPLLTSGADLGYVRDIEGKQSRKHIGAYGSATLRRAI